MTAIKIWNHTSSGVDFRILITMGLLALLPTKAHAEPTAAYGTYDEPTIAKLENEVLFQTAETMRSDSKESHRLSSQATATITKIWEVEIEHQSIGADKRSVMIRTSVFCSNQYPEIVALFEHLEATAHRQSQSAVNYLEPDLTQAGAVIRQKLGHQLCQHDSMPYLNAFDSAKALETLPRMLLALAEKEKQILIDKNALERAERARGLNMEQPEQGLNDNPAAKLPGALAIDDSANGPKSIDSSALVHERAAKTGGTAKYVTKDRRAAE